MLILQGYCYFCQQSLAPHQWGICCYCLRHLLSSDCVCPRCGLPSAQACLPCGRCQLHPPPWQQLCFVSAYKPPLSQLVKRFKFHQQIILIHLLGRLLLLCWREQYRRRQLWSRPLEKPDLILAVPLYRYRYWWRGYNQADLLAKQLALWLACPYDERILQRQRATSSQHGLTAAARRKNLRGAFTCGEQVKNRSVLLLDDVVTTGSTISEISRLLLAKKAKSVQILALCRTF